MIERKIRLKLDHFYSFWVAAPKGPTTYGTTQGDSKSLFLHFTILLFLYFYVPPSPPDPQDGLSGPQAVFQILRLASQAFWLAPRLSG